MNDMRIAERDVGTNDTKIAANKVQVFYGTNHALKDVDVNILDKTVTAFIGPSGCGKSTFLRCLNRMNDTIPSCRVEGRITLDSENIYDTRTLMSVELRAKRRHGVPETQSVPEIDLRECGLRSPSIHGLAPAARPSMDAIVQSRNRCKRPGCSTRSKDRLQVARHRAFGRPAAAPVHSARHRGVARGDPDGRALLGARSDRHGAGSRNSSTNCVSNYTIVIVTHSMQQAARVSQKTAFFHLGYLVEYGETGQIFTNPKDPRTESYITGRIG